MDMHELTRTLNVKNQSKIVMLVADGLGGLPEQPGGPTELEAAKTPNLDQLARRGTSGLSIPVKPGITPGSGPGHLGLFGYDPLQYVIGRGALEATGIGIALEPGDVAARCNFCTVDSEGRITDRRAGRIATERSAPLAARLRDVKIDGVEILVEPVKEHRFVVVFRGEGLDGEVDDTDPQATGIAPLAPAPRNASSERTAQIAGQFIRQSAEFLAGEPEANFLTMRGFSARPDLPSYEQVYGLRGAAIAVYPMYKGLAKLVGMTVVGQPKTLDEQMNLLEQHWEEYDFFFVHYKYTDSTGEDGDFAAKVEQTERFDAAVPRVVALTPTVIVVTGDHSTPSMLASHSWHPVPTLLVSGVCRDDDADSFNERQCRTGGLGHFEAKYLMPMALANAGRLAKYGA